MSKGASLMTKINLTFLEKQQVLNQAATTGDDDHLDKCGHTVLSQTGPLEEEQKEEKERQRHWIPKREP
jgi:hypothetical protein